MKKITIKKFYAAAVFCFLLPIGVMAQDEGFDDNVDDEVAMPLDNHIITTLLSACLGGYILLKKNNNKDVKI
ncbi:MAG: hypothetical protein EOO45_24630 [Flavobacterium sp.]|nr:MAG: hypothetical protein EOO45_24630 [Flavobacterium sp.]